jgi:O-antigen/teichoic acid export membrane protein
MEVPVSVKIFSMSESIDASLKAAVKGTTLVFLGTAVSSVLWFATKVLIVRNITTEELGIYSLAVAIVSVAALVAQSGLQEGATRFVSISIGKGQKDVAAGFARSSVQLGFTFGLVSSIVLYALSEPISLHVFYKPELVGPLRGISLFPLFTVLTTILVGVIRGYGDIRPKAYFLSIGQPLCFLTLLIIFFAFGFSYISVVYAFVLAIGFALVCVSIYSYKKVSFNPVSLKSGKHWKELLHFSIPLLGVAVMGMVFNWTDTLMLGRYAGTVEVGIYSVSISLARLLTFVLGAAGFVYMPIAGELYSKNQMFELKRSYQVLTKWVFSATLPAFFVLFFFPETTIKFLFGEGFIESATPLRLLALGYMTHVFMGINSIVLMVMGLTKRLMQISIFGALLNIALNYILIKRLGYGINGAAIATTASYVAVTLINSLALYWHSGVQPITAKYLRPVAGSAVIGLLLYVFAKKVIFSFWLLPVYLVLFVSGYLFSLLITRSLDREDIEMFEAVSKRSGLRMEMLRKLIHKFAR